MRRIEKGSLAVLEAWKRRNPGLRYRDLVDHDDIKDTIRRACVAEQYGLCAYCCRRITSEKSSAHNEHVEAQSLAQNRTLDFSNIVASCNHSMSCGRAHASQSLRLTPLMPECESELKFELSGLVNGVTERARSAIKVLRLGSDHACNRGLIGERKQMLDALLYTHQFQPAELVLEDDEVLEMLIEDLMTADTGNELPAFSPVLINAIRHIRATSR